MYIVLLQNIDILFLCLGHGEAVKFLASNIISPKIKIIDLSQDFRLAASSKQGERNFDFFSL